MTVENLQKRYNLSREATGRLLKISIRTVDRYLKSKKLSSQLVDGRVWLEKSEVERFMAAKDDVIRIDSVGMSTPGMSMDNSVDTSREYVHSLSTKSENSESERGVYKKLYLETKEELREKQERLEIANYRVGQLESQIRQSIPMLKYHQESYERSKAEQEVKEQINESLKLVQELTLKIRQLNLNKKIFLFILLIILALQPLWLIVYYSI